MGKNIKIDDFSSVLPFRPQNSNKGTFGKVLNIAGSSNYIGAAFLSSLSPLKIGAGLVTLACPKSLIPVFASKVSEITFLPLPETQNGSISEPSIELFEAISSYDIISVGCGLGQDKQTQNFLSEIFKIDTQAKWVIDADALNIISLLNICQLPQNCVLTPHPMELSRLLNVDISYILNNRMKYAFDCSEKFNCITLLKGHETIVTDGEDFYLNQTGSSALAKAGSGDVLTGIISGLAAQKLPLFEAAIKGAYIHGLSGEFAARNLSEYSVLANDLINYLPDVILNLTKQKKLL